MTTSIVEFLRTITDNDYLTLFLISIIPIIELRGAIVIMAGMDGINMLAGMFCCVAGSTTVILPLLLTIRPIIRKLKGSKLFEKLGMRIENNLLKKAKAAHINNIGESGRNVEISAVSGDKNARKKGGKVCGAWRVGCNRLNENGGAYAVESAGRNRLNKNDGALAWRVGRNQSNENDKKNVRNKMGKVRGERSASYNRSKGNSDAYATDSVCDNRSKKNDGAYVAVDAKNTQKRKSADAKKFLGLFVFVAIPLPFTGAWTGSCIGCFTSLPIWKAATAVFFGNVAAAMTLTIVAALLPIQYVDFLLYGFVIMAVAIAISMYFAKSKRAEKKHRAAK